MIKAILWGLWAGVKCCMLGDKYNCNDDLEV